MGKYTCTMGLFVLFSAVIFAWGPAACAPRVHPEKSIAPPQEAGHVAGQILVRFRNGVARERIDTLTGNLGGRILKPIGFMNIFLIELPEGIDVPAGAKAYGDLPEVKYAEPNYKSRLQ